MDFDRKVAGRLLGDPDTYGSVLLTIALSVIGEELFSEELDVLEIYARLEEAYRSHIPEQNENKINAMLLAVGTNAFYDTLEGFVSVAAALYDGDLGDLISGFMGEVTLPECLWAIYEVELMRDGENPEFHEKIAEFLAREFEDDSADLPDVDGLREDYVAFMEESKSELLQQFRELGIPDEMIRQL